MDISVQVLQKDGWDVVNYKGPINEETEVYLGHLVPKIGPKCIFNFRNVEYVNSCGVRGWINFMRGFEKNRELVFEECTSEIVMQINMIPSFKGTAVVKSVYGSYACENCGHSQLHLFEESKNFPASPTDPIEEVICSNCQKPMEMEELEEEFFAFLA